jgi:hypothetical protein
MTVTTNDRGQMNMWAKEPEMSYVDTKGKSYLEIAEMSNGRWAMVGFVAGVVSYTLTGNFFFGVF